jgi:hypothetical protein
MRAISGRSFGDELTKLWGFKGCRDVKIHIPVNGIVTITAEFNATIDQMDQCESIIKKYQLEEMRDGKEIK